MQLRRKLDDAVRVWRQRRLALRIAVAVEQRRPYRVVDALYEELPPEIVRVMAARVVSREADFVEMTRDGRMWRTDTGPGIGEGLIAHGAFEPWKEAAVIRWLGDARGTVADIGANIGTSTLAFAEAGFDVVAVEAIPATFEMLRWNVERNGYADRVRCVNAAVGEMPQVEMWATTISGHGEVASDAAAPGPGERITVRGVPLDAVVESAALVWMDIQGAETAALRTGRGLWSAGVPVVCEVDPGMLEAHGGRHAFVDEAARCFRWFTPLDDLRFGRAARPIADLAGWIGDLDEYGDALFHHQAGAPS